MSKPSTIAVVASFAYSLVNFRLELLKAMVGAGHKVTAFAPEHDEEIVSKLNEIGVAFVQVPMERTGVNPVSDLQTLLSLHKELRRLKPDVVLSYTMKPVIYSGIAARLAGVPKQYALMTGLGYVFSDENYSLKKKLVRKLSVVLYRIGLAKTAKLFVYNTADKNDIVRYRMVTDTRRLIPIDGTGVDLTHYSASDPPTDPVTFLLIARLLREKGIYEFVEAAADIRSRHPQVRFQILGPTDPNPSGITPEEIDKWASDGVVEYLGETRDVRPYIAGCSVVVLPTYYREGIPRSILEALSSGRAIITTDMPGCNRTVDNGMNGHLVKPRDAAALANAMEQFVKNPNEVVEMGSESLKLAKRRFDVKKINKKLLDEMGLS